MTGPDLVEPEFPREEDPRNKSPGNNISGTILSHPVSDCGDVKPDEAPLR